MSDSSFELLAEYARHRQFLNVLASRGPQDAIGRDAALLLSQSAELSEGRVENEATFPQCTLVWSPKQEAFGSGVYIGGRLVVTASHVATSIEPTKVSIGIANAKSRNGSKDFAVDRVCVNKDVPAAEGDICALVLADDSRLPTGLPKVAPATTPQFESLQAGLLPAVTVCGFGCGWPKDHPELRDCGIKRSITVPIVSDLRNTSHIDAARFFIAGDSPASGRLQNICRYDSGSPAFDVANGQMTLFGIASFTLDVDAATIKGCGTKPFGVFTRVDIDAQRNWLSDVIAEFG